MGRLIFTYALATNSEIVDFGEGISVQVVPSDDNVASFQCAYKLDVQLTSSEMTVQGVTVGDSEAAQTSSGHSLDTGFEVNLGMLLICFFYFFTGFFFVKVFS